MPDQRPPASTFDFVAGWRCPICTADSYLRTVVAGRNGHPYETEFYECSGCSLMFRHPGRFARLGVVIRRWASDVEPRTLREHHGFVVEPKKEE
jgi:hypothetical protein